LSNQAAKVQQNFAASVKKHFQFLRRPYIVRDNYSAENTTVITVFGTRPNMWARSKENPASTRLNRFESFNASGPSRNYCDAIASIASLAPISRMSTQRQPCFAANKYENRRWHRAEQDLQLPVIRPKFINGHFYAN